MAKQTPNKKNIEKQVVTKPVNAPSKKEVTKDGLNFNLFDFLENHFAKNERKYLIALLLIAVVFSFFCFDTKISTANDDALYIEAGFDYSKNFFGYFYTANAPLYPIVLSFLIRIFGVNLIALKMFSILFFALGIYFFFKAFRTRIPYIILIPALFIVVINFPFLMYASLTYAETFSLFIMGLTFYYLFKIFDKLKSESLTITDKIPMYLAIGGLVFLQMMTRNVALIFIGIVFLYFVYQKKIIDAIGSVLAFGTYYFIYKLVLKFIWKLDGSQFEAQSRLMFQKDAYNASLGKENFSGFIDRFFTNAQIYISSRFMYVLGFREEMSPNNLILTLVGVGLIAWAFILMWRKKQDLLMFTSLYFISFLAVTFLTLHTSWGQTRLIMIYLPLILFSLFYILYYYGSINSMLQFILPLFVVVLFFSGISATSKKIANRLPIFIDNMTDNPYAGYTSDWMNYIAMSKWCGENIPKEDYIACRKPPMSFVFSSGRKFYGIYNVPAQDADSLLTPLKQQKVTHIFTSELRLDPDRYIENQYINTVQRYMYNIVQKYPNAFEFMHREGDIEKSDLYKINWTYIDSLKSAMLTKPLQPVLTK
ncbi:MAG TPA: hypothetical protein PKO18_02495 [Chitinophagales bacterium]|nr:hypothetical protein [Chitinophagales bacterium]